MIDTLEKKLCEVFLFNSSGSCRLKSSPTHRLKLLLIPGIIVNLLFETKGKKQIKVHIAIIQGIHSNNSLGYTVQACSSKQQGINLQAAGIDRNPCKSIKLSIDIDRYPCEPIKLGNRHRSIPLQTYYIEQQASIDTLANPLH